MSILAPDEAEALETHATFGSGGAEPYATALRKNDSVLLELRDQRHGKTSQSTMDVSRWNADADETDLTLLRAATGPLLDIGCGPGRMVRAAMDLGLEVLGIDVSPTAIEIATNAGLSVLTRSVFEAIPSEGEWQTALLVDGNIGIGGDVRAMLARCREILAPEGEIVIETHTDARRHRSYFGTLTDTDGGQSESFPWAEIGITPLIGLADAEGLELLQAWTLDGRNFCRLAKTASV